MKLTLINTLPQEEQDNIRDHAGRIPKDWDWQGEPKIKIGYTEFTVAKVTVCGLNGYGLVTDKNVLVSYVLEGE